MVKNTERVAKIGGGIGQGDCVHRGTMKLAIVESLEIAASHVEGGRAGVHAMQDADAGGDKAGPAPAAAPEVKPSGLRRQFLPGKQGEISIEHRPQLGGGRISMVELAPLAAKRLYNGTVNVGHAE